MPPFRLSCLILGAIIGTGIASAVAQLDLFRSYTRGLTQDDLNMMSEAAQRLYQAPAIANGSSTAWRNNRTGDSGLVTFDGIVHRHGLLCRKLTYAFDIKTQPNERHYTMDWCKTADGSWKMG